MLNPTFIALAEAGETVADHLQAARVVFRLAHDRTKTHPQIVRDLARLFEVADKATSGMLERVRAEAIRLVEEERARRLREVAEARAKGFADGAKAAYAEADGDEELDIEVQVLVNGEPVQWLGVARQDGPEIEAEATCGDPDCPCCGEAR